MIELGKYAVPVLTAWAVTLVLIGGIVVQTLIANARARHALEEVERRG